MLTSARWKDNHLHLPNRPNSSPAQHPWILRRYTKGWFALAHLTQIPLCGKGGCSHCCEILRSSASFKRKAGLVLRCSQSYFHTGFISTGSASQDQFGTRYMNKELPVSVVDGKLVKQIRVLLSTFFPKFQWKPDIKFPLFKFIFLRPISGLHALPQFLLPLTEILSPSRL